MNAAGAARFLRTAARLHPRQVAARLQAALRPAVPAASLDAPGPPPGTLPAAPAFAGLRLHHPGPAASAEAAGIRRGRFTLYGWTRELGHPRPDWMLGERRRDRLFAISLHYHGFAPALAVRSPALFKALIDDWIARCGPGQPGALALAWNPYAAATRIAHWCRAHGAAGAAFWRREPEFHGRFVGSLRRQAALVFERPEWHLLGNHLVRDALGMAAAAAFFGQERAEPAGSLGSRALAFALRVAPGQVLPDGGPAERSPMYHAQVLEDLLAVRTLLEPQGGAALDPLIARMRGALTWMRHPDGQVPLLNDSTLNGAAHPATLGLGPLPQGSRLFPDTGLFVHHGPLASLFFDVGEVGDRWQPGHAHADSLSFECSWKGERLVVDPGAFGYDDDDVRAGDRSTLAHNTLCIDGRDSSECWSIFRVGRRARPRDRAWGGPGPQAWASAAHDGYRFLPGRPLHRRRVAVDARGVSVSDEVRGGGVHQVEAGLLLAPGWSARARPGGWDLRKGPLALRVTVRGPAGVGLSVEDRPYHPGYGVEAPARRLCVRWKGALPLSLEWRLGA